MGLSTKQVSSDDLGFGQSFLQSGALELPEPPPALRKHQQSEPLPCPRCGSTNTKFCYYNNYNKSQPRHFCKACKRHWTKGGTLRNVPVGGGRKNKRLKTSNTAAATTKSSTVRSNTTDMGIQSQKQYQNFQLPVGDQKNVSEILYQALIRPPAPSQHDSFNNSDSFNAKSFSGNNGNFLGSTIPNLVQNQTPPFTFSNLSSGESNRNSPSSISTFLRSSDAYNFTGGLISTEDPTIAAVVPDTTSNLASPPWQVPATSSFMDMPNYWNWDDIDSLVPTELNILWDDNEIKP